MTPTINNIQTGGSAGYQQETARTLNARRMVEARKWVTDEMEEAAKTLCSQHSEMLAKPSGINGRPWAHMFSDDLIAKALNLPRENKAVQADMISACTKRDDKYFYIPINRNHYTGINAMDCEPARYPMFYTNLWYRVRVNPRDPNVVDRFVIDKVFYAWSFCQWSAAYDLKGTAKADVIY
mgnify:CR=1 FL=1|tara:strand:+ start:230 stop:772 length:543 start_codon:yes stop_codon:yes gene_type:complete